MKWLLLSLVIPLSLAQAAGDPCETISLKAPMAFCQNPELCTQEERVALACHWRLALLSQYGSLLQKDERLKKQNEAAFQSKAHFSQCIEREKTIEKDADPLAFFHRLLECTNAFEDSHLSLEMTEPLPEVFTGIYLTQIGSKFYIRSRDTRLINFLRDANGLEDLDKYLAPGTEVVKIDGEPPVFWQKKYFKFTNGSSQAYRHREATYAIFSRNFDYPQTDHVDIEVTSFDKPIRLTWWTTKSAENHSITKKIFGQRSIKSNEFVSWSYDTSAKKWAREISDDDGYSESDSLVAHKDILDFKKLVNRDKQEVARIGRIDSFDGKTYCYFKLLTFKAEEVAEDGTDKFFKTFEVKPSPSPLVSFLTRCRDKNVPLILDLRSNPGGTISLTHELFSFFVEKDKKYPSYAIAYRVTELNQRILASSIKWPAVPGTKFLEDNTQLLMPNARGANSLLVYDEFEEALARKKDHTDIILHEPVVPQKDFGPNNQKIVALITPYCISSCDIFAAMLKQSKRATLIGTSTNGTGAGTSWFGKLASRWDDLNGRYHLEIPNLLFGVADKLYDNAVLDYEQYKDKILSENKPTNPDIVFEPNVDELTEKKNGWLDAIDEHFRKI